MSPLFSFFIYLFILILLIYSNTVMWFEHRNDGARPSHARDVGRSDTIKRPQAFFIKNHTKALQKLLVNEKDLCAFQRYF